MPSTGYLESFLGGSSFYMDSAAGSDFGFYENLDDLPEDLVRNTVSPTGASTKNAFSNLIYRDGGGTIAAQAGDPNAVPWYFRCVGDVVLDRPLALVGLPPTAGEDVRGAIFIETDEKKGCRIYSTKSIFIQGHIVPFKKVSNPSNGSVVPELLGDSTLIQLSSARAVVFGFSDVVGVDGTLSDYDSVNETRGSLGPLGTGNDSIIRTSSASGGALQSAIVSDALASGSMNPNIFRYSDDTIDALVAYNPASPYANVYKSGSGENLFMGRNLVVHAPLVLWNYTGVFTGSVIAEIALFPKGLRFVSGNAQAYSAEDAVLPLYKGSLRPLTVID